MSTANLHINEPPLFATFKRNILCHTDMMFVAIFSVVFAVLSNVAEPIGVKSAVSVSSGENGGPPNLRDDEWFGGCLVAPNFDLNEDGKVNELLIGAYGYSTVYLATVENDSISILETFEGSGWFGYSCAWLGWDLNSDGKLNDFAIGAPFDGYYTTGSVFFLSVSPQGSASTSGKIGDLINGGPNLESDSYFGRSVSWVGGIDASGTNKIAVGADGYDTDEGSVYLFSVSSPAVASDITVLYENVNGVGILDRYDYFGRSILWLTTDLNGDGFANELVVGTPGDDFFATDAGAAYVYSLSRSDQSVENQLSKISGSQSGSFFGRSLCMLPDINRDGLENDIAIGSTEEDNGGDVDAGALHLITLSSSGTPTLNLKLTQTVPGMPNLASNTYFGISATQLFDTLAETIIVGAGGTDSNKGAIILVHLTLPTPSPSVSPSALPTPSQTPSVSPTPTNSPSTTATPSNTPSQTATPSGTPSHTPSVSPTPSTTPSTSGTPSASPSQTATPSSTPSQTPTGTSTPSSSPSSTPTPSPTPTVSPTPSQSPSSSPSILPVSDVEVPTLLSSFGFLIGATVCMCCATACLQGGVLRNGGGREEVASTRSTGMIENPSHARRPQIVDLSFPTIPPPENEVPDLQRAVTGIGLRSDAKVQVNIARAAYHKLRTSPSPKELVAVCWAIIDTGLEIESRQYVIGVDALGILLLAVGIGIKASLEAAPHDKEEIQSAATRAISKSLAHPKYTIRCAACSALVELVLASGPEKAVQCVDDTVYLLSHQMDDVNDTTKLFAIKSAGTCVEIEWISNNARAHLLFALESTLLADSSAQVRAEAATAISKISGIKGRVASGHLQRLVKSLTSVQKGRDSRDGDSENVNLPDRKAASDALQRLGEPESSDACCGSFSRGLSSFAIVFLAYFNFISDILFIVELSVISWEEWEAPSGRLHHKWYRVFAVITIVSLFATICINTWIVYSAINFTDEDRLRGEPVALTRLSSTELADAWSQRRRAHGRGRAGGERGSVDVWGAPIAFFACIISPELLLNSSIGSRIREDGKPLPPSAGVLVRSFTWISCLADDLPETLVQLTIAVASSGGLGPFGILSAVGTAIDVGLRLSRNVVARAILQRFELVDVPFTDGQKRTLVRRRKPTQSGKQGIGPFDPDNSDFEWFLMNWKFAIWSTITGLVSCLIQAVARLLVLYAASVFLDVAASGGTNITGAAQVAMSVDFSSARAIGLCLLLAVSINIIVRAYMVLRILSHAPMPTHAASELLSHGMLSGFVAFLSIIGSFEPLLSLTPHSNHSLRLLFLAAYLWDVPIQLFSLVFLSIAAVLLRPAPAWLLLAVSLHVLFPLVKSLFLAIEGIRNIACLHPTFLIRTALLLDVDDPAENSDQSTDEDNDENNNADSN